MVRPGTRGGSVSETPIGTASAPEAPTHGTSRRRPTNGVASDLPADGAVARAARPRSIERVRGTFDRLPADALRTVETQRALHTLVGQAGYAAVDTPVLEHTELFLRKSGGDRVAQLYAFTHHGRNVALRPEFTASVVRQFIEAWQGEPLPVRVAYTGPVFRYEKPQAGRARQFTEFGCELIGASGVAADVEVISLALDTLEQVGIERPRLVLGHIGIVAGFLAGLHVDQRAQDWLTWSMERTRKRAHGSRGNPEGVGVDAPNELDADDDLPPYLRRLEAALDVDEIDELSADADPDAVASILRQTGVAFQGGSRTPEEIVRGLFAKRDRRYDAQTLRDAAAFVERLTELAGPPEAVLGPIRDLVRSRALDESPIDAIEQTVALLRATRDTAFDIHIDLGMGRGLHYYTGMLFEIYAAGGGLQLCGGGRYDDLASVLGARQPVAACGFSLGLERVLAAAPTPDAAPDGTARVLVVQNGDNAAAAVRLAAALRATGWQAVLDLRRRNPGATRATATRQGYGWIAHGTPDAVRLLDLASGAEQTFDHSPTPQDVKPHE